MGQFISAPLNVTSIPSGIYDFNMYASLTNNNSSSYLIIEFYKLSSTLIQTLLFTMTGLDINSSVIIPYNINSTQPAFNINLNDSIMIKIYGKTTSLQNVIINIDYNSSNNYSHFHIPLILRSNHNDLLNIQGGSSNDYQHLTTSQLNNINNPSTISNNGYLLNTDFSIFNNKEPAINKNTAFNRDFETLATNIKINGTQSIGASNNIARSDHVHPSDTTKQDTIIATTFNDYYRGDKTFQPLNKSAVGLSNVDNTTDLLKPISTATQTALNLKQNNITLGTTNQYFKGDLSLGNQSEFLVPNNGIIYVNGLNGLDTNDGLSLLKAYKTISAALSNTYINSGLQLVIQPSTYTANLTISQNNLSIVGTNNEIGGIINLNNDITITSNSTSIRLCSLTFNNLTISGSANVYLKDCNINNNLIKSGSGYLSISNCIFNITSTILISGSGNTNIMNGCQLGSQFTVSNSGAIVVVSNNQYITNVILTAGIISIFQTVIYGRSTSPIFNCCTVSGTNSALYLNNCDLIDSITNAPYIIVVAVNNFFSLRNCTINYNSSTLSGTNLGRTSYFDNISSGGGVLVDTTSTQILTNKQLTDPKLTNNILKSSTNNNINIINVADTLANLNSIQVLTNKQLTDPKLTNNIIKSSTNNNITLVDTVDTLVNLNSAQTISNKTLSSNTIATTQISSDNSTKIATTAFVKSLALYPVYKDSNVTNSSNDYLFQFGPNNYLEFVINSGILKLRTNSNYNFSLNITHSCSYVYNINGGGYIGGAENNTLGASGVGAIVLALSGISASPAGRGINIFIFDITNNYIYRGYVMCVNTTVLRFCYFIEQIQ